MATYSDEEIVSIALGVIPEDVILYTGGNLPTDDHQGVIGCNYRYIRHKGKWCLYYTDSLTGDLRVGLRERDVLQPLLDKCLLEDTLFNDNEEW